MTTPRMPRRELPDPYKVEIVLDSIAPCGVRLTTYALTYPRMVHAELMTHRVFCLAGDAVLEFDLPAGAHGARRVHKMTLAEFVGKWLHGARPHRSRWGSERTYDLKPRLREMQIRQLNEATGEIETSTIENAIESGMKPVYELCAGRYRIAGSLDHRILTSDGWKTIGEIRIGDDLIVSTRKKPDDLKADSMRLKKINGRWRSVWQREQRDRLQSEDRMCRDCRKELGVEIHHIVSVQEEPARAFDEANITLLCDHCHTERHRKQGWQTGVPLYAGRATVDTIRFRGVEPTYDLSIRGSFPNFLANQVVVHNSRNSASSRAIPSEKMRALVREHPALPVWWGKNQAGMQAREELSDDPYSQDDLTSVRAYASEDALIDAPYRSARSEAKRLWLEARDIMIEYSDRLAKLGLHKQLCNRLTEAWMPITVLVSATTYANWDHLRDHKDAQPELQIVATEMIYQRNESTPQVLAEGEWHTPYIRATDRDDPIVTGGRHGSTSSIEVLQQVSVGRCARVSFLTHEGVRDLGKDLDLHDKLAATLIEDLDSPGHFSPFEHVAEAMPRRHAYGNFVGWRQYRKHFANEAGPFDPGAVAWAEPNSPPSSDHRSYLLGYATIKWDVMGKAMVVPEPQLFYSSHREPPNPDSPAGFFYEVMSETGSTYQDALDRLVARVRSERADLLSLIDHSASVNR